MWIGVGDGSGVIRGSDAEVGGDFPVLVVWWFGGFGFRMLMGRAGVSDSGE